MEIVLQGNMGTSSEGKEMAHGLVLTFKGKVQQCRKTDKLSLGQKEENFSSLHPNLGFTLQWWEYN